MKKWTKKETDILQENMDATLNKLKTLLPDRNDEQIVVKIKLLYRQGTLNRWTDEELDILRLHPKSSIFDLMKFLPDRTFESIRYKLYHLNGIEHFRETKVTWTEDELYRLEQLKKEGYTNYEIAEMLGRPLNSVMGKLYSTGKVRARFKRKIWTTDELDYVRLEINKGTTIEDVADKLGVESNKIYQKAVHLGINPSNVNTARKEITHGNKSLHKEIIDLKAEIKKNETFIKKHTGDKTVKKEIRDLKLELRKSNAVIKKLEILNRNQQQAYGKAFEKISKQLSKNKGIK